MRIFYGLALLLVARDTLAQWVYPDESTCSTPDHVSGTCINIKSCPSMLALLTKNPLTNADRLYLQQSQCGFEGNEPKVCCPRNNGGQQATTTTTTQRPTQRPSSTIPDVTSHPNLRLLGLNTCGVINSDRIVGGTQAGLTEFPWMALLAYDVGTGKPEFRCGGSIINNRYILTAAHCVTNLPSNLRLSGVRVGEWDMTTEQDCKVEDGVQRCNEPYQDFGIESAVFHPEYSRTALHNDIALIRVNRNIDFRPANAKAICLPVGPAASQIKSTKLTVTGWGVYEARVASPVMLKVTLPIFDQEQCTTVYKRQTEIWYKQICMGGQQGKDSCSGDSGGPLQAPVSNFYGQPRYVQHGIVSFGVRNCGTQGFPGVYTRTAYYLDWVLDNLRA